jgi:hypothetical protein
VIEVLRETDDALTLDHLLNVVCYVAEARLPSLINAGMLRVATDIFVKNIGGVGLYVGRDAIRLISILAPSDTEGTKRLGVVGLIVRGLETSTDPYIRWYALMSLRKIDPSIIRTEAQEIFDFSTKAMAKDRDEDTRTLGASTLLVAASTAPEIFEVNVINILIDSLRNDLSTDVQACAALALQFLARATPPQLRETKIGEALFETIMKKLKTVKTNQGNEENEILVIATSTMAILALKDATALIGGKGIEQIDPVEAIFKTIEEGKIDTGIRSVLFSALLDLSEKAPQYINSRRVVESFVGILEGNEEEDTKRRVVAILKVAASTHPALFSGIEVMEKLARISLSIETERKNKAEQSKSDPLIIFQALMKSDDGVQAVLKGFGKVYKKSIVIEQLSELENWKPILNAIEKGEPLRYELKGMIGAPTAAIKRMEPSQPPKKEASQPEKAETKIEKGEGKERKFTEEKRRLLQEIFRTYKEIRISELAEKLDVDQDILKEALDRLSQSGKLTMKIEDDVLHIGKESYAPAVVEEKKAPPVSRREGFGTCLWCGAEVKLKDKKCANCGKPLARCLICDKPIHGPDQVQKCPFCGSPFHPEHYSEWAQKRKSCPKCGINWANV